MTMELGTSGSSAVVGQSESRQQLRRAEEVARLVSSRRDLYEDTEAWASHQELTTLYRQLLLADLEFALDRKVEQDLWNVCFKNYIGHLQTKIRDKRSSSSRGDSQLLLSWFLEFASGFYTTFLTEIQQKFSLDIPFLKSGDPYGIWAEGGGRGKSPVGVVPGVTSCHYLCQHCLVHLGDVARYRNQLRQAETFYRHAVSLAPGSGQPYNQIAILEAARGNKLSSVYFYVRAVCLKYPFPAASTNLSKMLTKLAGADTGGDKPGSGAKMSPQMFVSQFLKLHGLLHTADRLRQAVKISCVLAESLTSLIVSDALSTWQLLQVTNINMWAHHQLPAPAEQLSKEEQLTAGVVASCQAALLSSCLLPVYTLQKGTQLLDYCALPAVRLLLEWVSCHPAVLAEKGFTTRPQIWPGLARLLNEIKPLIAEFSGAEYRDYPLPEDYDMQSFSPLQPVLARYNMKQVLAGPTPAPALLARLRCARLVKLGLALARQQPAVISYCEQTETFEAVDVEWPDTRPEPAVLVEEIEMLEDIESSEESDSPVPVWDESSVTAAAGDKTRSILKLKSEQASPSPASTPSPTSASARAKPRLFQRNVAMAAILSSVGDPELDRPGPADIASTDTLLTAAAAENKKVMFKTPSPSNSQSTVASLESGSQVSVSQDQEADIPVPLLPNPPPPPRRSWSPAPALEPAPAPPPRTKICVDELDFTVPPPSLHSNVRPPSLFSPPGGGPGPAPAPAPVPPPASRQFVPGIQPLPMLPPQQDPGPQQLVAGLASMGLGAGDTRAWPRPGDTPPQPSHYAAPAPPAAPPGGHNPLLQLISSVSERPSLGPGPGMFTQSYSLFSPSAWPGPLLSSPSSGSQPPQPPQPPQPGDSNMSMFGAGVGGPSPLERLLHQAKHDK